MKLESIQNYSYNTKYSLNKPRFKALRVGHFECANKVIHSAEKSLPREIEYYKQNLNIKSDKQKKQVLEIKLYKYLKDSVNNIDYIVSTLFGDIDKLDKLTDSFINKEIAPICLASILFASAEFFKEPDYEGIEHLFKFREKALKHKQQLSVNNEEVSNTDIDKLIFFNPDNTIETLNILGEKTFLYAFKDKKENLSRYIETLGANSLTPTSRERLIQLTNPTSSYEYEEYQNDIKKLKDKYKNTTEKTERKLLQDEINTLTFDKNNLIKNSIKDPKTILDTALILCSSVFDKGEYKIILEEIQKEKKFSSQKLVKILQNNFYDYIGIKEPSDKVKNRLQIKDDKYLLELFKSNIEFSLAFTDLIKLMETAPEKSNKELFDSLPANIKTRKEFEKLGLNYDKWCDSNSHSFTTNEGYTFRKVDMNNIPYALFLGNYADCCTKVNGIYSENSIKYIKNKMFQAIEILDKDNNPMGNTMCYIATLNDKLCMILDNIEIHPLYKNKCDNLFILNNMAKIAREITKSIGAPDMQIFLSTKHNDINTTELPREYFHINLVGSTDNTLVYFDFARQGINPDKMELIIESFAPLTI